MASHSLLTIMELAFALLASGVLAGLLIGLFGAYGGLAIVPVLHPVFTTLGMQGSLVFCLAAGISLALVVLTAAQSWRRHHRGNVPGDGVRQDNPAYGADWRWPIAAGAVACSVVVAALPGAQVQVLFTCAMLAGAVKMLFLSSPQAIVVQRAVLSGRAVSEPVGRSASLSPIGALGLGGSPLVAPMMDLNGPPAGLPGLLRHVGGGVLSAHVVQVVALLTAFAHRLWGMAGRATSSPVAVCGLLAIPAVAALGLILFGNAQLPLGLSDYRSTIGVGVILLSAMLLVPVGAELSGQFSKRVLEISLGLFLLLAAGQFAYNMLLF